MSITRREGLSHKLSVWPFSFFLLFLLFLSNPKIIDFFNLKYFQVVLDIECLRIQKPGSK
jgi:hypothetical protein